MADSPINPEDEPLPPTTKALISAANLFTPNSTDPSPVAVLALQRAAVGYAAGRGWVHKDEDLITRIRELYAQTDQDDPDVEHPLSPADFLEELARVLDRDD